MTHPLQVTVNAVKAVHVFQASGSIEQLLSREEGSTLFEDRLTNLDLEAFGKLARYSLRLPYSIRAEMVESGEMDVSIPRRGSTFGWFRFFQVITSL